MSETLSPSSSPATNTTSSPSNEEKPIKKWYCDEYGAYIYRDLEDTDEGSDVGDVDSSIELISLTTRDSSATTTQEYSDMLSGQMTSSSATVHKTLSSLTTITLESPESSHSTPLSYTPSIESPKKLEQLEQGESAQEQQHKDDSLEKDNQETTPATTTPSSETPKRSLGSSTLSLKRSQSLTDQNVLIIINNSISMLHIQYLWSKCSVKICADGGANKLFNMTQNRKDLEKWIPDYIKGDLDSLKDDVSEFYSKKGTTIIQDTSQDTTDLQKCMELVSELEENTGVRYNNIFIAGGLGGNTSHEMANLNTLFLYKDRKMILVSNTNVSWLLDSSQQHEIDCRVETKCSLLPLGQPVEKATTNGLKWNLVKQSLNFGGLVSTSNLSIDTKITVDASHPILFIVDTNDINN
ncbi:hypothetical protein CYY_008802 [Polysphondylium violaceum]|uniref:Thiamin pyrophosphokinase thiamin-binding domain-containing protein n=1 Tax=Polysphondylium violaceum TaxID=133409 RepID=A0A8J4PL14_9MYCE|nr:hypothetical protein CYY_008802 [Polysphondylium violaceum]